MSADEIAVFILTSWVKGYDAEAIRLHLKNRHCEISKPLILQVIRNYINNQTENTNYHGPRQTQRTAP